MFSMQEEEPVVTNQAAVKQGEPEAEETVVALVTAE